MKAWYTSEERFKAKIEKQWQRQGKKYNAGNVQLLKYSFRALIYWNQVKGNKVSQANKVNIEPKLF